MNFLQLQDNSDDDESADEALVHEAFDDTIEDSDPLPGSQQDRQLDNTIASQQEDLLHDYGQYNDHWIGFLNGIKSSKVYTERVNHFLLWQHNNCMCTTDLLPNMIDYFKFHHDATNATTGKPTHAPTSLTSWFSILKKFWKYIGKGNLEDQAYMIVDNLRQWDKTHEVTKATTFTKEELGKMAIL